MIGRAWLVAALVVVGCSGLEEPEKVPIGILRLFAQDAGGGESAGRPDATFVLAAPSAFPDSRQPSDLCQLADLVNLPVGTADNLDAGDSLAFITTLGTTYLYPKLDLAGNESYSAAMALLSLTPGAAVTFQIPGAQGGFPAATFTALTAPAVTELSPIPTSLLVSDSVVVTWAPVGDDSSSFEVALQWATEASSVVNRQLLCQWRDDGRGVITGSLLSEWITATLRHIETSRYRTFRKELEGGALLHFLATYDLSPEPAP
jgi:hypothetical protein